MPSRKISLVTNEIYHIFNKGIAKTFTFRDYNEYARAIETIKYYRTVYFHPKLSRFLKLSKSDKSEILKKKTNLFVDVLCYCLMPNHFHFLLKQKVEKGISKFLSQFQNSYTRYFNTKNEREGPLFLGQFKAVRVETDEQLLHVSRYIHLNPYASFIVKDLESLRNYKWSSLSEFLNEGEDGFCSKDMILTFFKDREAYGNFVFDQADYQRELDRIKHLLIDST